MASRNVSKARILLQQLTDEVACTALITVAARLYVFELRHPRFAKAARELVDGLYAGYAWGTAFCPLPFGRQPERDRSWEAVESRAAQRAAELGIKVVN